MSTRYTPTIRSDRVTVILENLRIQTRSLGYFLDSTNQAHVCVCTGTMILRFVLWAFVTSWLTQLAWLPAHWIGVGSRLHDSSDTKPAHWAESHAKWAKLSGFPFIGLQNQNMEILKNHAPRHTLMFKRRVCILRRCYSWFPPVDKKCWSLCTRENIGMMGYDLYLLGVLKSYQLLTQMTSWSLQHHSKGEWPSLSQAKHRSCRMCPTGSCGDLLRTHTRASEIG